MADKVNIQQAQQDLEKQFWELHQKTHKTREFLDETIKKIRKKDFSQFGWDNLTDGEKAEIERKYQKLLEELKRLEDDLSLTNLPNLENFSEDPEINLAIERVRAKLDNFNFIYQKTLTEDNLSLEKFNVLAEADSVFQQMQKTKKWTSEYLRLSEKWNKLQAKKSQIEKINGIVEKIQKLKERIKLINQAFQEQNRELKRKILVNLGDPEFWGRTTAEEINQALETQIWIDESEIWDLEQNREKTKNQPIEFFYSEIYLKELIESTKKDIEALNKAIGSGEIFNTYGNPKNIKFDFDAFDYTNPGEWANKQVLKLEEKIRFLQEIIKNKSSDEVQKVSLENKNSDNWTSEVLQDNSWKNTKNDSEKTEETGMDLKAQESVSENEKVKLVLFINNQWEVNSNEIEFSKKEAEIIQKLNLEKVVFDLDSKWKINQIYIEYKIERDVLKEVYEWLNNLEYFVIREGDYSAKDLKDIFFTGKTKSVFLGDTKLWKYWEVFQDNSSGDLYFKLDSDDDVYKIFGYKNGEIKKEKITHYLDDDSNTLSEWAKKPSSQVSENTGGTGTPSSQVSENTGWAGTSSSQASKNAEWVGIPSSQVSENSKWAETLAEILKINIRSVGGIFREEIRRDLLEQADEDGKLAKEVVNMRKYWQDLFNIYTNNIPFRDTKDKKDNLEFLGILEKLVDADVNAEITSRDFGNLLLDSKKFIDALRRRIKNKKQTWPQEGNTKLTDKQKKLVDFIIKTFALEGQKDSLNKMDPDNLIKYIRDFVTNQDKHLDLLKSGLADGDFALLKQQIEQSLEEQARLNKTNEEINKRQVELQRDDKKESSEYAKLEEVKGENNGKLLKLVETIKNNQIKYDGEKIRLEAKRNTVSNFYANTGILVQMVNSFEKSSSIDDDSENKTTEEKDLDKIEGQINRIINGVKISVVKSDGEVVEKTIDEISHDLSRKYTALENKLKAFSRYMMENEFDPEKQKKFDEEIQALRYDLKDSTAQYGLQRLDDQVLEKTSEQEEQIYAFLIDLQERLNELSPSDREKFMHSDEVVQLRRLHNQIGHFQNESYEEDYIKFIYFGDYDARSQAKDVAKFHSGIHKRILENAFGNPQEGSLSKWGSDWWANKGIGVLGAMAKIKDKDVGGMIKVIKWSVNTLGSMGYDAAKVMTHYPTKLLGNLAGKTLDWMIKEPEGNWFTKNFKKLLKAPIRIAYYPAWLALKPAEKILKGAANFVGGELSVGGVSAGNLDNFIKNMAKDEEINTLWDGVFKLHMQGIGIGCNFAHEKLENKKREALRKYFHGKDVTKGISLLRGLKESSNARALWHGVY